MLRSLISALCATFLGIRFGQDVSIRWSELARFLSKNFSLGLCYGAFVRPATVQGSVAAGRAAYLCCAYDVVTDWRSFSPELRECFEKQLRRLAPKREANLLMDLYWTELRSSLKNDGLERGVIALEVILGLVGSGAYFSQFGVHRLGCLLQVLDDVLDLERDTANGETNCLLGPSAAQHLDFLDENKRGLRALFRKDPPLRSVIERAFRKAQILGHELQSETPEMVGKECASVESEQV